MVVGVVVIVVVVVVFRGHRSGIGLRKKTTENKVM